MTEGVKLDQSKPRWSLLPEGTIQQVIEVLEHGVKKYSEDNWQHVPDARKRYYNAAMRHMEAWWTGERVDEESGLSHLSHASCCLLFLAWFDGQEEEEIRSTPEQRKAILDKIADMSHLQWPTPEALAYVIKTWQEDH